MSEAAQAFVDDVDEPVLDDGDRHHFERVLRLAPGESVRVGDGRGRWRPCVFESGGRLTVAGEVVVEARPDPSITIAFALTKGEKPELVVQKLTELGVDTIIPFVAARSIVRWDDERGRKRVGRLRRVAREAAMQSRRSWLPTVAEVSRFPDVADLAGAAIADGGGAPPSLRHPTLLVGPEGGWTEEERGVGLPLVRLGDQVLRAETAAIAGAAVLGLLRRGMLPGQPLP
jgi:16S rRNA (uracil1498-N3)-methyltransferase